MHLRLSPWSQSPIVTSGPPVERNTMNDEDHMQA